MTAVQQWLMPANSGEPAFPAPADWTVIDNLTGIGDLQFHTPDQMPSGSTGWSNSSGSILEDGGANFTHSGCTFINDAVELPPDFFGDAVIKFIIEQREPAEPSVATAYFAADPLGIVPFFVVRINSPDNPLDANRIALLVSPDGINPEVEVDTNTVSGTGLETMVVISGNTLRVYSDGVLMCEHTAGYTLPKFSQFIIFESDGGQIDGSDQSWLNYLSMEFTDDHP